MKPHFLPIFIIVFMFAACATTQPETPAEQSELVAMTALPQVSSNYPASGLKLNILFRIMNDGSVAEVKMIRSSGDPDWDKAAIDSMKSWHFTPLQGEKVAADRWVRNTIILLVQESTVLTVGELYASSEAESDSLYALLQNGSDFETLSKQVVAGSTEPRGKFIGAVDIARYPKHVRDALRKIALNEVTNPLRLGTKYVIFKRFKPDGIQDISQ